MQKYSEKFLNKIDILKYAIIGFEFEFYMKDLSYYKTLELLNQQLNPIRINGFKVYHPQFTPHDLEWILTPDLSGGQNLLEIVTSPMSYIEAKYYLTKMLKFISTYGYTSERCSIHYNISFNSNCTKNLNDLNILKLILNTNEDEIYKVYPTRKDNVYAKSVKKMIPYKEYDFNDIPIDIIKNNLRLPNDKYYGINFLHINKDKGEQRLEFRYIGGAKYEQSELLYFLDLFIINTYDAIDASFNQEDIKNLEFHLDKNISTFKNFSKYDNFLVEFPTITIQIDQYGGYDVVNAYYNKIYSKIYNLIDGTNDLKDCILNYVPTTQRLEIVDAIIDSNFNIKDYDFINCKMKDGIFEKCDIINSEVTNSQLLNCNIQGCDITGSKILNCNTESSDVKDSFIMNGYFNADLSDNSVFRSGKLGPYAFLSDDTKVVTDNDNFFDTKFDNNENEFSKKDDGIMKGFKK